jgi:hypothetical protein
MSATCPFLAAAGDQLAMAQRTLLHVATLVVELTDLHVAVMAPLDAVDGPAPVTIAVPDAIDDAPVLEMELGRRASGCLGHLPAAVLTFCHSYPSCGSLKLLP